MTENNLLLRHIKEFLRWYPQNATICYKLLIFADSFAEFVRSGGKTTVDCNVDLQGKTPMGYSKASNLAKRDFLTCVGIWLALEVVCFAIFPALGLIQPSSRSRLLLLISLPLGIVGALLLGVSSQLMLTSSRASTLWVKVLRIILGQLTGWVGLLGIAFPLLVGSLEFFTTLFSNF